MKDPLPISAIVVARNEARHLEACLSALVGQVDEILFVDLQSTDSSLEIARRFTPHTTVRQPCPIPEPVWLETTQKARNSWLLLVDPDEHYPPTLFDDIRQALAEHPQAAAFRLPWLFHFKGKPLRGTIWGSPRLAKMCLLHRQRCQMKPILHCFTNPLPGYETIILPRRDDNAIRHYWADSYCSLLHRHLARYAFCDARRLRSGGTRFGLGLLFAQPWRQFMHSLRDFDGWRMGLRGLLLSAIFGLHHVAVAIYILGYQLRGHATPTQNQTQPAEPAQRRAA
ncbi:MAG: glycosyltransferase [Phycisphaeraceae bacterium]|nr:glycosyltransferase [Phycisphaeraceae bacterium]